MQSKWVFIGFLSVFVLHDRAARAANLIELAAFTNSIYGPTGDLAIDSAGNIFGTTASGVFGNPGVLFEVPKANRQSILQIATFTGALGSSPQGLSTDSSGNIYGTTSAGGTSNGGTVFQLTGANHQTVTTLASFDSTNTANGYAPGYGLAFDSAGNIYGENVSGGANGTGRIFELSGTGHQTVTALASLDANFAFSTAGLGIDAAGNLYGIDAFGSAGTGGNVFKVPVSNPQTLNTLASISTTGVNSYFPYGGATVDAAGDVFGTNQAGGAGSHGGIFEYSASTQKLTTVAYFTGNSEIQPLGDMIMDAAGNLFGIATGDGYGTSNPYGFVFELSAANHQVTNLINFSNATGYPDITAQEGLVADAAGNLYGWTDRGNSSNVFEITNSGFVVPVPEPTSLSLLALGSVAVLSRRRCRDGAGGRIMCSIRSVATHRAR